MNKLNIKSIEGFDCMEFKRKVQDQIYQETKSMTSEQFMEYVHRQVGESEIWKKFEKKPAVR